MSRSAPRAGRCGSPGFETASSGQGFGFSWQKRRKSLASAAGRITTLPCAKPSARPEVWPVCSPDRTRSRAAWPAFCPLVSVIGPSLRRAFERSRLIRLPHGSGERLRVAPLHTITHADHPIDDDAAVEPGPVEQQLEDFLANQLL